MASTASGASAVTVVLLLLVQLLLLLLLCARPTTTTTTTTTTTSAPAFASQRAALFYAWSSFCPHTEILNWSCFWCTHPPAVARLAPVRLVASESGGADGSVFGFVGLARGGSVRGGARIVVVFRGSVNVENWLSDLDFVRGAYPDAPGALVHHGFFLAYESVAQQVLAAVREMERAAAPAPVDAVLVTGHSLGAALANLCALNLSRAGYRNVALLNFGQPRVGNRAYAEYFVAELARSGGAPPFRAVWRADSVPHLPFELLGFHHAPTELWFPHGGTNATVCSDGFGEDPRCCDSLPVWDWHPSDHLHYLGFDIASGRKFGC